MPQLIVIDEIGTELEALADRKWSSVSGIQYVTISDEEAKRRGTQKSNIERKSYPAFQLAIEVNSLFSWTIYENVE
eukprot:CCRYP_016813-RA/>CCRYP_016813-RA protein AED:0.41 eAED:0.41 QI:0/0/0/1/0/0/2/0/75